VPLMSSPGANRVRTSSTRTVPRPMPVTCWPTRFAADLASRTALPTFEKNRPAPLRMSSSVPIAPEDDTSSAGTSGDREVRDRGVAQLVEAALEVGADLVLLRVDRLEADLHLGGDRLGLEAARVVQLEEGAILVAEVAQHLVEVRPALLLHQ